MSRRSAEAWPDRRSGWARPVIGTAAFLVMLSTVATVLDAFPRVLAALVVQLRFAFSPQSTADGSVPLDCDRRVYRASFAVLCAARSDTHPSCPARTECHALTLHEKGPTNPSLHTRQGPLARRAAAMTYDFNTCPDRRGTGSLKWERYPGRDVVPMWVADMDFLSAPEIIDALQERAAHGVFGYTIPPKSTVEAAIEYLKTHHDYAATAEEIVWFPGLVPALNIACRAFVSPGEDVLTCTPVYPPFLSAPEFAGVGLRKVDLSERGGVWDIDFEALEAAVTPKTKLFILCNPHNPVGRVFPESTIARIAEFCRKHKLVLISDEIHCDLVLDDVPHTSGLKFAGPDGPPIVAMFAPSKTFNLAGLACAFLVIPDAATRRTFQRAARGLITEINAFGYAGCEAALRHGWPWRDALLDILRGNRDHVEKFVSSSLPGVSTWHVEATYLAWLDARALGLPNACKFFEDHGVGLSDGVPFGAEPGFLRLNFGCPRTQLDEALNRMARALASR